MTRTAADAFLQAILQAPDDDTPRLVYADWLEEQGEDAGMARAEFIRIQCALARERLDNLTSREQELLKQYEYNWAWPIRGMAREWQFHRGFIDTVKLPLEDFVRHTRKLFLSAPLRHLHLRARIIAWTREALLSLSACRHLRNIQTLDLHGNLLDSTAIQTLCVGEYFTQLTSLNLSLNQIGDAGLRALVASSFFPRLTSLDLSRNTFTASGVRRLIEACEELAALPQGLQMRKLVLRGNRNASTVRRLLLTSPLLRDIVRW